MWFLKNKKKSSEKIDDFQENQEQENQKKKEQQQQIKNTVIHVMPEKFHADCDKIKKAKNIGLSIIIGGSLLIISMSILFYYFVLKSPEKTKNPVAQNVLENVTKPVEKINCVQIQNCDDYADEDQCVKNPCNIKPSQCLWDQTSKKCIIKEIKNLCEQQDGYCLINADCKIEFILSDDKKILTSCPSLKCCVPFSVSTSTPASVATTSTAIAIDTDKDGLSDKEEKLLGSQKNNIDSDGDGYDDLLEVMNLYNPIEERPDRLINNKNIIKYQSSLNYSIFYPASWLQQIVGGDDSVIFKSDDGHFIQVITQPNNNQSSITNWYKSQFEDAQIPYKRRITTNTWSGIKSEDELILYLTDNNYKNIFILSYTPKLNDALEYQHIFEMMIESFLAF